MDIRYIRDIIAARLGKDRVLELMLNNDDMLHDMTILTPNNSAMVTILHSEASKPDSKNSDAQ